MNKAGVFCAVLISGLILAPTCGDAKADVSQQAAMLLERAVEYNRTISTPIVMSLDQRRLLAVNLAASELRLTDPDAMLYAYMKADAFVVYLLQSDTSYNWEDPPGEWVPEFRSTFTYSSNNVTQVVTQMYDTASAQWQNSARQLYSYANGRVDTLTTQAWGGSDWVNTLRIIYTYDGSGFPIEVVTQNWTGAWSNLSRTTSSYNGNKLDSTYSYGWDTGESEWLTLSRSGYTYSGELLQTTTVQTFFGSIWMNSSRTTLTYNSNLVTQTLVETWDIIGNAWQNSFKSETTYDGTNDILTVSYGWSGGWTASDADTTHYSGNQTTRSVHYNILTTALDHTLYTYNGDGTLRQTVDQDWSGSSWVNVSRDAYVYIVAGIFDDDSVVAQPAEFDIGQNYPNPFNLNTVIPYTLAGDSHVKITVCNILGQTISTLIDAFQPAGAHTAMWDGRDAHGRDAASGIYFTRVQVGALSQVRKMVLLK